MSSPSKRSKQHSIEHSLGRGCSKKEEDLLSGSGGIVIQDSENLNEQEGKHNDSIILLRRRSNSMGKMDNTKVITTKDRRKRGDKEPKETASGSKGRDADSMKKTIYTKSPADSPRSVGPRQKDDRKKDDKKKHDKKSRSGWRTSNDHGGLRSSNPEKSKSKSKSKRKKSDGVGDPEEKPTVEPPISTLPQMVPKKSVGMRLPLIHWLT